MTTVIVHEITMATPDKICLEIWDSPILRNGIVDNGSTITGATDTWVLPGTPIGGITDYGYIIGPNSQHFRFQDKAPLATLDRVAASTPANYSTIGGLTVTAVDYLSTVFDYGKGRSSDGIQRANMTRMKHFVYLTLSGVLAQGTYTIHNSAGTAGTPPDATLVWNDKTTRCCAIRNNQTGYRRSDSSKLGYLSLWTTSPLDEGAVDYINTYGLNTFEIIDDSGRPWFRGQIVQRIGADDVEPESALDSATFSWVAGDATASGKQRLYTSNKTPLVATAVTDNGNGTTNVAIASHGYTTGQIKWFRNFGKKSTTATVTGCASGTGGKPRITTSAASGVVINQSVIITSVGGVTGVNGQATVTAIIDTTHFEVSGTFGGAYTGGGTVVVTTAPMTGLVTGLVITVVDANTISVPISTAGQVWVAGAYRVGFDSLVCDTIFGNRARTCVFGIDFGTGSWTPAKNTGYRIRIPGLGVGDRFVIDDGIWGQNAKTHIGGYFNQCNGIAKDGRYGGYTTPAPFVDGVNGVQIFKSKLPSLFSDQNALAGASLSPAIPSHFGAVSPWVTTTRNTGWFGCFFDAGDWDTYLEAHIGATTELLTLGYQELKKRHPGSEKTNLNYPKSSATLDPTIYTTATDALPDCVHAATWVIDAYRRLQNFGDPTFPDGSVMSGFCPGGVDGAGNSIGSAGLALEPSYLSQAGTYTTAPDHAQNYLGVFAFAKMAQVYGDAGFPAIKTLFNNAAIAAWNWAESIYQDNLAPGGGSIRDAYYGTTLGLNVTPTGSVSVNTVAGNNVLTFSPAIPAGILPGMTVLSSAAGTITAKTVVNSITANTVTMNVNVPAGKVVSTADTLTFNMWTAPASNPYGTFQGNLCIVAKSRRIPAAAALYRSTGVDTYRYPCEAPTFGFLTDFNLSGILITATINGVGVSFTSSSTDHLTNMAGLCAAINSTVPNVRATNSVDVSTSANKLDSRLITVEATAGGTSPVVVVNFVVTGGVPTKSPPSYGISVGNAREDYWGMWEYNRALPGSTLSPACRTALINGPSAVTSYMTQSRISYQNLMMLGNNQLGTTGAGIYSGILGFVRSFILSEEALVGSGASSITRLQEGEGHELGANQYGHCWTIGLGARSPTALLHADSKAASTPAAYGMSPYVRDTVTGRTLTNGFNGDQIQSLKGTQATVQKPAPIAYVDLDNGYPKTTEPFERNLPLWLDTYESPDVITQMEHTTEEKIIPRIIVSLWLHSWDGNSADGLSPGVAAGARL